MHKNNMLVYTLEYLKFRKMSKTLYGVIAARPLIQQTNKQKLFMFP